MIVIQRYTRGWLARRKMKKLSASPRYVRTYVRTPIVLVRELQQKLITSSVIILVHGLYIHECAVLVVLLTCASLAVSL